MHKYCRLHGGYWAEEYDLDQVCPVCKELPPFSIVEVDKHGKAKELADFINRCPTHHKDFIGAACPECADALEASIEARKQKEFDPNGKAPSDPGSKLDGGKPLAGVLGDFALALMAVAEVGTHGAEKYSRGGWQSVPDAETRYHDAEWRHLLKRRHEDYDKDSGLLHDAHRAWNVLAQLELRLRKDLEKKTEANWEVSQSSIIFSWSGGSQGCPHIRTKFVKTTDSAYRQCLDCGAILQTKTPLNPAAPPDQEG